MDYTHNHPCRAFTDDDVDKYGRIQDVAAGLCPDCVQVLEAIPGYDPNWCRTLAITMAARADMAQTAYRELQAESDTQQQLAESHQKQANQLKQLTAQVEDERRELAAQVEDKRRELAELSAAAAAANQSLSGTHESLKLEQAKLAALRAAVEHLDRRVIGAKAFMDEAEAATVDTLSGIICKTVAVAQATAQVPNKQCANCNKLNGLLCCGTVYYCNRECQLRNWHIHKHVCLKTKKTDTATATVGDEKTKKTDTATVGDVKTRVEDLQRQYLRVLRMGGLSERLPELLKLVRQVQICRRDGYRARACDSPVLVTDELLQALDSICGACRDACTEWIYTILFRLPDKIRASLSTLDSFRGAVVSSDEEYAATFAVIEQICSAIDLADGGQHLTLPPVYLAAATQAAAAQAAAAQAAAAKPKQ